MTPDELLEKLLTNIPENLRRKFEIDISKDYYGYNIVENDYFKIINKAFPSALISNKSGLIEFINSSEIRSLDLSFSLTNDMQEKISMLYKYCLLKLNGEFQSNEEKLNFVLNSNNTFNFLYAYKVHGFGSFTAFPASLDETDTFIKFITDNYGRINFYLNINDSLFNNRNLYNFENLKCTFLDQINQINYESKKKAEINWIAKILDSDACKDYLLLSYAFYKHSIKNSISLESVLKSTSDPLVYYITLFFSKLIKPLAHYSNYLTDFIWEENENNVLYVKKDQIIFLEANSRSLKCNQFTDDGKIKIFGSSPEYLHALQLIIGDTITRQDLKTIVNAFGCFYNELRDSYNSNIEKHNVKKLNLIIKENIAIYDSFKQGHIKAHFFKYLLESLDQKSIEKLSPKRIAYIKTQFDKHIQETAPKIIEIQDLSKIKTTISAKQLALFIRLLFDSEIIDNRKHKVEPLLQLISSYFSSVDKDDLSAGSLNKNYYAKDYHSDLLVLKAKLIEIQKHIEELQNN